MLLNNDLLILVSIALAALCYPLARYLAGKLLYHKKELIIRKHKQLRLQSLHLMQTASQYMLAKNAETDAIDNEVTYADFYRQLKSNHVSNLSDKVLIKIKHSNNPMLLEKAEHQLQRQERKLREAESILNYAHH
jgi:hypothetical protein